MTQMKHQFKQINEKFNEMVEQISNTSIEYDNYSRRLSLSEVEIDETEEIEKDIIKVENYLDRYQEMHLRNQKVITNCSELINSLDEVKDILQQFLTERKHEGNQIGIKNNQLIDFLKYLSNKQMNIILNPFLKEIESIKEKFQERRESWNDLQIDTSIYIENNKNDENKLQLVHNSLSNDELNQIEEWTEMKIIEILFDSENDDWTEENGVFNERIIGEDKLIFIIKDNQGNTFGGFVNERIVQENKWISDPNAFLFSLKRLNNLQMTKYDVNDPTKVFYLWKKQSTQMCAFGSGIDIGIYKKTYKESSWCNSSSERTFDYHQMQNVFIQNNNDFCVFNPERICVFKLK